MPLRFEDDLCQRDLAARVGISRMHVSRIIRSSVTKLSRYSLGAPEA
jgi:DNA-directed RNA polymerase specialized sigma subunit